MIAGPSGSQQTAAVDCLQRPLVPRSRFRQPLRFRVRRSRKVKLKSFKMGGDRMPEIERPEPVGVSFRELVDGLNSIWPVYLLSQILVPHSI